MQDVIDRLHTDDLAGRGDKGDLAKVFPYPRQLLIHLANFIQSIHLAQLIDQVGQHAAGSLMQENVDIDNGNLGVIEKVFILWHDILLKDLVDCSQLFDVKTGVAIGAEKGHDQGLQGSMRGAVCIRGHTGVNDIDTGLNGLEMTHRRHAGGEMAVQMDRCLHRLFQGLDQGIGVIGCDKTGHILDTDGIGAHGLQVLGLLDVIIQVVNFAAEAGFGQGVADAALEVFFAFFDLFDDGLKVPVIVEGVEGTEDIHAVLGGTFNKGEREIIGVISITDQVLRPQQHGKRSLFDIPLQGAKTLPRIFIQEAVHGIEGGAAPGLYSPEADFVHHLGNRNHVLSTATGGKQGLMTVAKGKIHYLDRIFCFRSVTTILQCSHFDLVTHCLSPYLFR